MRRETQQSIMRRLFAAIHDPAAEVKATTTHLSMDRYTDPHELAREEKSLFRRLPVIAAHISEIPNPRDFVTETIAGVPLIILRDDSGDIRVFINACRHRGARLIDDVKGACKKLLTCRYHAWSYGLDGALVAAPGEEAFGGVDKAMLGLRAIPHEIRHGFVWAALEGDKAPDIRAFLGPALDDDFESFSLADQRVARKAATTKNANWKLVMDAFAEGYHLQSLHRDSLSRFFLSTAILDDCAPHVRQVGARRTLLEIEDGVDGAWDLRRDTTVFYNLFPNVVLVFHPLWVSQMSLFPEGTDHVRVVHRMLASAEPLSEESQAKLERSFEHIHGQVFEKEDLAIAESIQSTLRSGANDHALLGGFEEGMRLFHAARDRALDVHGDQ